MKEIVEITELGRLFLKTQGEYGAVSIADCNAYQAAFEAYRDNHPHFVEAHPDPAYRDSVLALRVRAFAWRIVKQEEAQASVLTANDI